MKSQEKNENGVLKGANETTKKKNLAWKEELVFWGNRPAVAGLAGQLCLELSVCHSPVGISVQSFQRNVFK